MGEIIKMSMEELRRLKLVSEAINGSISQREIAELLELSYRQTKRLVARVREEGDGGIIHRLRGKQGNRRIDEKVKARVLRLCREKYRDFGPTLASEKLREKEKIPLDHDTLRLWLRQEKGEQWAWQRRARPHRKRRERKQYFGEMVQMDGSHHDWLEGRGAELVLMGYIDDASGTVFGRFYDYEGTIPALDSFWRYCKRYGLPQAIYLDRHTTYKSPSSPTLEQQLRGEEPLTQFGRAMKELGVKLIPARSPQAKGRIERSFETHQDRLVKNMRLAGIKTKAEANQFLDSYLPEHNAKFSVIPAKKANLHRKRPPEHELRRILCIKNTCSLSNDAVIRLDNRFYQLRRLPNKRISKVVVEERLDGSMQIRNNGTLLKWREIPPPASKKRLAPRPKPARQPWNVRTPAKDHPWKQPYKTQRRAYVQKSST